MFMQPLDQVKVIEMAGRAPSSYCGMLLADFGAKVTVVDRLSRDDGLGSPLKMNINPFSRGKRSIRVNLKAKRGPNVVKRMIRNYDVLIDSYRPGVLENLGLGPNESLKLNKKLIYARLTGWGQYGRYAQLPGHDINYLALSGALSLFRRKNQKPLPPCNLLGDFAGGGMLCAVGILLALIAREKSGRGQIVDASMIDGVANLTTLFYGLLYNHLMSLDIGTNMLDGGAPYYQVYETADHKYMAVGAIEAKFYDKLLEGLGINPALLPAQNDRQKWDELKSRFVDVFKTKTREEWTNTFEDKETCVTPVLEIDEAPKNPFNTARQTFIKAGGLVQPAPAPRLSETPGRVGKIGQPKNTDTSEILKELGYQYKDIDLLLKEGIVE